MTNILKDNTSIDCANEAGAPDVLYIGNAVELRVDVPKQALKKGHRAFVDKISPAGIITILPFGPPKSCKVSVKEIFKLDWA